MPALLPTPWTAFAGLALLAGAGYVGSTLAWFWGANPDFADRFLIPLAAVWSASRLAAAWVRLPVRPRPALAAPLLIAAAVAFPAGAYLTTQVGPRPLLLWWLTGALIAAAAGTILAVWGYPRLRAVAFPLAFLLVALPLPTRFERPLQDRLQTWAVGTAEAFLKLAGQSVERRGFELHLPSGGLEVVEACSGIRSLTALTALAALIAHVRGFGPLRGLALVLLAPPVVALCNGLRIAATGLLQEHVGPHAASGTAHELLGGGMVLVGLAMLVALSSFLAAKNPVSGAAPTGPVVPTPSRGLVPAVALGLAAAATAWLVVRGTAAEAIPAPPPAFDAIPREVAGLAGTDEAVPAGVAAALGCDAIGHRVYRDGFGRELHTWVIFWEPRTARLRSHHPDVCWGNRGWTRDRRTVERLRLDGGREVEYAARWFRRGPARQYVTFWTQEGNAIAAEEDEVQIMSSEITYDWIANRLFAAPVRPRGRLAVLVGTESWGADAAVEKDVADFLLPFAAGVYRACPWADPPSRD